MLTPQNFREKTFERAVFGGYDMAAVDDFLEEAAGDYSAIAKENMVLKSKMKVLVEKIEEYRSTEDSMRQTLLSAQKLCTQLEQETREKTEKMLGDARLEAEQITREAHNQRMMEESKLLELKKESTNYIEGMRLSCAKHLEFLEKLDRYTTELPAEQAPAAAPASTPAPAAARSSVVEDTVRIIESAAGDSNKEIGRVVQGDLDNSSPFVEEPTRPFDSASMEGIKFGK